MYLVSLRDKQVDIELRIRTLEGRLNNQNYAAKAPKELIEESKKDLAEAKNQLKRLLTEIKQFQGLN